MDEIIQSRMRREDHRTEAWNNCTLQRLARKGKAGKGDRQNKQEGKEEIKESEVSWNQKEKVF